MKAWLSQKQLSLKGEASWPEETFNWFLLSESVFTDVDHRSLSQPSLSPHLPTHWPLSPKPLALLQQLWSTGYISEPRRTLTVTRTTNQHCLSSGLTAAAPCCCCKQQDPDSGTTESRPGLLLNVNNSTEARSSYLKYGHSSQCCSLLRRVPRAKRQGQPSYTGKPHRHGSEHRQISTRTACSTQTKDPLQVCFLTTKGGKKKKKKPLYSPRIHVAILTPTVADKQQGFGRGLGLGDMRRISAL